MTKRRVFDIDFPDDPPVPTGTKSSRKGPMASAISENAQALRERAELEQRIRAENDALAAKFVSLRSIGLVVDLIPLSEIHATELTRDRKPTVSDDLDDLKASIRDIGLSNPIRVARRKDGYQLIQGYRRLQAYRELLDETGDQEAYGAIPGGMVAEGETLAGLYRRMVDENLIRKDISFAEMAELARSYASDPECEGETIDEAVSSLYASAGRQKKIYIRNFASLLEAIGDLLEHAEAIPRNLGLAVWSRITRDPSSVQTLRHCLVAEGQRSEARELQILKLFADGKDQVRPRSRNRTKFDVEWRGSVARINAADGRLEVDVRLDFAMLDQERLRTAVQSLLDDLYPASGEGDD